MRCPTPVSVADPKADHSSIRIDVPCGRCGICKKKRRDDWRFRLSEEFKDARNGYFLTLTYSDEHVQVTEYGELTLNPSDLFNFSKRLRYWNKKAGFDNYRYYQIGEYGTTTDRPHYHVLGFNVADQVIADLDDIWGLGHTVAGSLTPRSVNYVAKFHVNKRYFDDDDLREDEFSTCSRSPGLGHGYLERNTQWHRENGNLFVRFNGHKHRLPRYYRERMFSESELKGFRIIQNAQNIKRYNNELDRLRNLGIEDPQRYIFESAIQKSQKIRHKSTETNIL